MDKELVLERLDRLIYPYNGGMKAEPGRDLMAGPASLPPYSMAALFLDIEKEFSLDLDELVPGLEMFSPNELADKIMALCSQGMPVA